MTKTFKLKNDKAGFCGDGIDLCGDVLDSVFPGACLNPRLTIVVSTQRQHRRGEKKVEINVPCGSRVPMVEIGGRKIQILYTTHTTIWKHFQGQTSFYIQMKFS